MKHAVLAFRWLRILLVWVALIDAGQRRAGAEQVSAANLTLVDIGHPTVPGSKASLGNGAYELRASGTNLAGGSDQFSFACRPISSDFDIKVQLAEFASADLWAKSGLMARENLGGTNRYAAVLATPGVAGIFFQSRSEDGAPSSTLGSFPVNYPYTWVRLRRTDDVFTGYAGVDGEHWTQLGAATLTNAPESLCLGLALVGANPNQPVAVKFQGFEELAGVAAEGAVPLLEPLGPSSRRTGLVITEIMYKPPARADGRVLDFIELHNSNPYWEDISGYSISGDVAFTFPTGTILAGGGFLVLAKSPADVAGIYAITNVVGPYTNNLATDGTLHLRNKEKAILLEIPFSHLPPWPVAADGTGHSLVLRRPSYGEGNPQAWDISDSVGGSPGRTDGVGSGPLRSVVLNELMANSEAPFVDYVELYNHGNQPVDISGCFLSDDPRTNKFVIPPNTLIPARGFVWFEQSHLPFGLSSGGETLYFRSRDNTRVLDAVRFPAQANGIPFGRQPDGAADFLPLQWRTPGEHNSEILLNDIVINEIMYEPGSGHAEEEYVELYNQGSGSVNLGDWRFVDGIDYTFPANTVLRPDAYLVVAKSVAQLLARYPHLNSTNTVGDFGGTLADRGERLALGRPDTTVSTNSQGAVSTNVVYVLVDEVTYGTGGSWGNWSKGGGSSLELVNPRSRHGLAQNWTDSDETAKAPWTTVMASGAMEQGFGATNFIEIQAMGEGEFLVDNIEVLNGSRVNVLTPANSTLDGGLGGWLARGNHIRSEWTAIQGVGGTGCLHVRASSRGDTLANRLVCPITMPSGIVTLRAQVRWLTGWPEVLLRLRGNYMEAYGRLQISPTPGTPGARNSRAVDYAAPVVYEVTHAPALPAANQPAVVTARVHAPEGISALSLNYRIDPATNYTAVPMRDDGREGDAIAEDGLYSATIPAQPADTLVAFQVVATDERGASRVFPLQIPAHPLPFECLVRFGDPILTSSFATYRQWFTQKAVETWRARPALSNEKIYGTFVYNNARVIYNIGARYSSSPYHQAQHTSPDTGNVHYVLELPADEPCLGTANWNKVHATGNTAFDEDTSQREQLGYWFARQMGLPWNYRRYVHMVVNGVKKGTASQIMEDTERAGDDFVDSRFPDDRDGNLYKMQPWFEVDDGTNQTLTAFRGSWCTLNRYLPRTNSSVHFPPRYRQNWLVRAAEQTANEFTPVYDLIDAANTLSNGWAAHTAAMESVADMEEWMRLFAVCHAVGDWDHFGTQNAQNMYGYKPRRGKWTLMVWDLNILLGNSSSWGPGAELFNVNDDDPIMNQLYAGERGVTPNPYFRRMYLRGLKEIAGGPMRAEQVEPIIDARQTALVAGGVAIPAANVTALKAWIRDARLAIANVVSQHDATNFVLTVPTTFTVSNNLVLITGSAPLEMKTLTVNGTAYPLVWTTVRDWALRVALDATTNVLRLQGYDLKGQPLPGFATTVTVKYAGPPLPAEQAIVFSEIMYNPRTPEASFVELFNRTGVSFDLSGWRVNGLDLTFPAGAIITNGQHLILCENRVSFGRTYPQVTPDYEFDGKLDPDGETLTLLRRVGGSNEVVVSKIRYESQLPWPTAPSTSGASLQVIDPFADISRPSNWAPGTLWSNVTRTGNIGTGANLLLWLTTAGSCFIDDITLTLTNAGATNIVLNGDFESALDGPWLVVAPYTNSQITDGIAHSGKRSLFLQGSAPPGATNVIQQWIAPRVEPNQTYTLSYWILVNTNPVTVNARTLPGSALTAVGTAQPIPASPGTSNRYGGPLPAYEALWLNELLPENSNGPLDNFGERDPWIEIHNNGALPLNLEGYFLANQYNSNLTQWPFPAVTIAPGGFRLIWADGEPHQSAPEHLHTSFRLNPSTGAVALVRLVNTLPQITDYLTYSGLRPGVAYGDFPDGQPFTRGITFVPTPGSSNISRSVNILINEWVAANTNNLADPADGRFDDWFELYNDGTNAVDLGGYYLTDRPGNPGQYERVPDNGHYLIPRGGFLLVWADGQAAQNSLERKALHVSFQLSRSGESIALYAPDGRTLIDAVTFGAQVDDVSSGRYPDGATNIAVLAFPTPGLANVLTSTNTAPSLTPIGTKVARQGQPFSFTIQATDAQAGQALLYRLEAGAPPGATLDTQAGLFSWTPPFTFFPTTNVITVRVEDTGIPVLSDTATFALLSFPPPPDVGLNGGSFSLSFQTIPGKTYRVDYKDSLNEPSWKPLGGERPAGALTRLTVTDVLSGQGQRFYRIVQLD